jgi:hypothetical protein
MHLHDEFWPVEMGIHVMLQPFAANCNVNLTPPGLFTVLRVRRKYLKGKMLLAVCCLIRLIPESYPANRC